MKNDVIIGIDPDVEKLGAAGLTNRSAFMRTARDVIDWKRMTNRRPLLATEREVAKRRGASLGQIRQTAHECEKLGLIRIRQGLNCELYELLNDKS